MYPHNTFLLTLCWRLRQVRTPGAANTFCKCSLWFFATPFLSLSRSSRRKETPGTSSTLLQMIIVDFHNTFLHALSWSTRQVKVPGTLSTFMQMIIVDIHNTFLHGFSWITRQVKTPGTATTFLIMNFMVTHNHFLHCKPTTLGLSQKVACAEAGCSVSASFDVSPYVWSTLSLSIKDFWGDFSTLSIEYASVYVQGHNIWKRVGQGTIAAPAPIVLLGMTFLTLWMHQATLLQWRWMQQVTWISVTRSCGQLYSCMYGMFFVYGDQTCWFLAAWKGIAVFG